MPSPSFFRTANLPPYALGEIAERVRELRADGLDIIDLSQINPNLGPPAEAVDKLVQATLKSHHYRYSSSQGIFRLREAFARWYREDHGVEVCPEQELCVTMGTKEGLAHLLLSIVSPHDMVLVPTPSYPIHTAAVCIAGAGFVGVPLFSDPQALLDEQSQLNGRSDQFFARLSETYFRTWPRPKLIVTSFPHNPTGVVVTQDFFDRLVEFAKEHQIYVVHDFAYADTILDSYAPPSILASPGAKEVAVECYSLSKGFGLPGWRIGCCAGNKDLVQALKTIKSYLDFGAFQPLQIAAASLLDQDKEKRSRILQEMNSTLQSRRDTLVPGLNKLGFEAPLPRASLFAWAKLPARAQTQDSLTFARQLLEEAHVAVCPGGAFDKTYDQFVRISLVESETRIRRALENMEKVLS